MNAVGVISFAYYYIELIAPNTDTSRVLIDLFASRGARPHPLHRSHTDLVDQTEKKESERDLYNRIQDKINCS